MDCGLDSGLYFLMTRQAMRTISSRMQYGMFDPARARITSSVISVDLYHVHATFLVLAHALIRATYS